MVFFNYATMQMAAKIVYYGPGLCGKTTNLHQIYAKTAPQTRGEMVSLETETDRTLFFDLLPLDVGVIGGFKTRLQLYTVPGQVFYNTTRKLVLKGADGIVFVADSQKAMLDANVESLRNLRDNLTEAGLNPDETPMVIQLNKRDLPTALDREVMIQTLDPEGRYEFVDAAAVKGEGVFETLKLISKLTLRSLRKRMMGEDASPAPPPRRPSAPVFVVHERPQEAAQAADSGEPGLPTGEAATEQVGAEASVDEHLDAEVEAAPPPEAEESGYGGEAEPPVPESVAADEQTYDPGAAAESFDEAPPQPSAEYDHPGAAEPYSEPAEETVGAEAGPEPGAEESVAAEEQEVAFAEDSEDVPIEATEPEQPVVRHVKVRSTVDIMAELEDLRKQATQTPVRGKVDVLSALDALTAGRSKREITRTASGRTSRQTSEQARRVVVDLTFTGDNGEIDTIRHELELDSPGWDTLKLNIRIDPESDEVR